MEKENLRMAEYPKTEVHWSVKLLAWAWIMAVVFIIGMVLGGITGWQEETEEGLRAVEAQGDAVLEVPALDQRDGFPTGCESVTAVMALNYAGIDISTDEFVDKYLPRGSALYVVDGTYYSPDPMEYFLGEPRSEDGWGCYAPVIKSAVGRVLKDMGSEREVEDLCGLSLEELVDGYIREGVPVMIWATRGMEEPRYGTTLTVEGSGRRIDWIQPEHCLLLVGEKEDTYLFNDPLEGKTVAYKKQAVQRAYEALGSQALAINEYARSEKGSRGRAPWQGLGQRPNTVLPSEAKAIQP